MSLTKTRCYNYHFINGFNGISETGMKNKAFLTVNF